MSGLLAILGSVDGNSLQKIILSVKEGKIEVILANVEKITKSIEVSKNLPTLSELELAKITQESEEIPVQKRTDADYLVLSMAAFRKNNSDEALQFAYSGLSQPSSHKRVKATLTHRVASALNDFGLIEKALLKYGEAIALDPTFSWPHFNRGILLEKMGREDEALAAYDKVIELDSEDALPYNNRGILFKKMGREDEALAAYDKAIELDPEYASPHFNRGILLEKMGREDEALASFAKARELDGI